MMILMINHFIDTTKIGQQFNMAQLSFDFITKTATIILTTMINLMMTLNMIIGRTMLIKKIKQLIDMHEPHVKIMSIQG